jgi:hypothetical protein
MSPAVDRGRCESSAHSSNIPAFAVTIGYQFVAMRGHPLAFVSQAADREANKNVLLMGV